VCAAAGDDAHAPIPAECGQAANVSLAQEPPIHSPMAAHHSSPPAQTRPPPALPVALECMMRCGPPHQHFTTLPTRVLFGVDTVMPGTVLRRAWSTHRYTAGTSLLQCARLLLFTYMLHITTPLSTTGPEMQICQISMRAERGLMSFPICLSHRIARILRLLCEN
jgi:hypothetical protein